MKIISNYIYYSQQNYINNKANNKKLITHAFAGTHNVRGEYKVYKIIIPDALDQTFERLKSDLEFCDKYYPYINPKNKRKSARFGNEGIACILRHIKTKYDIDTISRELNSLIFDKKDINIFHIYDALQCNFNQISNEEQVRQDTNDMTEIINQPQKKYSTKEIFELLSKDITIEPDVDVDLVIFELEKKNASIDDIQKIINIARGKSYARPIKALDDLCILQKLYNHTISDEDYKHVQINSDDIKMALQTYFKDEKALEI